jgi:DNA invertase Pin-like site-specific DNA recombinase
MKVISYTRFSSKRQAKGDSFRRQTEMSAKWCRENGYELDTVLHYEDLGVSAWSGANTEIGAFSEILQLAKHGKIPSGSILIIEALDRLTRQSLRAAIPLFIEILNTGLTVVTLVDGKRWTADSLDNMAEFMLSVLLLSRGFEESERKSGRLREKYEEARRTESREPFGAAPGWLVRESKSAPWTIVEEKAESVRKVFNMAIAGYGSPQIAKRANTEKWPVPTRLGGNNGIWHVRMPGHILRQRAVLGEHEAGHWYYGS